MTLYYKLISTVIASVFQKHHKNWNAQKLLQHVVLYTPVSTYSLWGKGSYNRKETAELFHA